MERRDYVQRQIDLLGLVLAKMLAKLTGAPDNFDINEVFNQQAPLPTGTTLPPLDEIVNTPTHLLASMLESKYGFKNEHLWQNADILFACASKIERSDVDRSQLLYLRSLSIYEHLLTSSKTFDLGLLKKVNNLKATLINN